MSDTKTAILDAAEAAFARDGIQGISLRAILSEAEINPALAHYHFGSKDNVIREIMVRRLVPLGQERIRLLDALENRPGVPGYTLRDVLRAFTAPAIRLMDEAPHFALLLGQLHGTRDKDLRALFQEQLAESLHRFAAAARRVIPVGLSPSEKGLRTFFFLILLGYTLTNLDVLRTMAQGKFEIPDADGLIEEFVSFSEAGILAGLPKTEEDVGDA